MTRQQIQSRLGTGNTDMAMVGTEVVGGNYYRVSVSCM